MKSEVRKYLAEIGRLGGQKSRRRLASKTAKNMVRLREARRAFKEFFASCFWSYDPNYVITLNDLPWVAEQLMKNGGRKAWQKGSKLCP